MMGIVGGFTLSNHSGHPRNDGNIGGETLSYCLNSRVGIMVLGPRKFGL